MSEWKANPPPSGQGKSEPAAEKLACQLSSNRLPSLKILQRQGLPTQMPPKKSCKNWEPSEPGKPRLLSGGNPQIPKGYGDAPVQDYIAAIPDWKQSIARRIDDIINRAVPGVKKAVKWNSPLYGLDGETWFLSFHCFDKYIKVAFHRGASLNPIPPVASKQKAVRYFHIHELDELDERQFADWVKQASALPGEKM
jgi:hypothetical protein